MKENNMIKKILFDFILLINMLFIFSILEVTFGQQRFAIIGDFGDDNPNEQRVADLVNSWNPEYIITTGDNSYDATDIDINIGKYYHDYIYPYVGTFGAGSPNSTNRFWVSLGNHDFTDGGGITAHYNYFDLPHNERYYDVVIGNVHHFMINSYTAGEPDGTSSTSIQADWIKAKMEDCVQTHQHWRVVAFHHPPYSSGQHQSSTYMRWPFQTWGAHFVVSGHDHNYERLEVSGFPYFVNGTGGRNLRLFGTILTESVIRDYADFGAQLVDIDEAGTTMTIKYFHADGVLIDTRTIVDYSLPVELSLFIGKIVDDKILLEWRTDTETNNYGFEIERSLPQPLPKEGAFGTPLPLGKGQGDGLWTKIGFVNGNGNSNSPKSYSFVDDNVSAGKYSYRLKQIDNDGQFEYSKTIEVDFGAPKKFELSQNYPNPFNPVTTIRFNLPEASLNPSQGGTLVKLTVYNILGQQVAVLVNDILESGVHTINFDASELNSGMYIYKIEAGTFVQTRKMTLVK